MTASDNPLTELTAPAVVWFDPGLISGWARLTGDVFSSGEGNFIDIGDVVAWHCAQENEVSFGWERFDITPATYQMRGSSWSLEVIGVIRWLALEADQKILDPQSRESRLMVQENLLKAVRWHKPGLGHANDAARHLLAWLVKNHRLPDDVQSIVMQYVKEREKA
jgi:hypothetical protein